MMRGVNRRGLDDIANEMSPNSSHLSTQGCSGGRILGARYRLRFTRRHLEARHPQERLSTPFYTSRDELGRLTMDLRSALSDGWSKLREALEAVGAHPIDTIVAEATLDDRDEPTGGLLVCRDGRVFGFLAPPGSHAFNLLPGDASLETRRRVIGSVRHGRFWPSRMDK